MALDPKTRAAWLERAEAARPFGNQESAMSIPGPDVSAVKAFFQGFWYLATKDMTPQERSGAWKFVTYGGVRIAAVLFLVHIFWACGWLVWIPGFGDGVVTEARAQEVAEKIVKETIKPLEGRFDGMETEQGIIKKELERQGRQLTAVHKLLLEREIREKACAYFAASPNSEQRNLANEAIRDLQRQYRAINGEQNFEIPKSEDLRCSANTGQ